MNTTLPLRRIRDFGEKVTDTIKFIKLNWKNLLVMYGIFVLPFLLVGAFLGARYFTQIFSTITTGGTDVLFRSWKLWVSMLLVYMAVNAMATSIYLYMRIWENENRRASPGEILALMPGPFMSNTIYTVMMLVGLVILMVPIGFIAAGSGGAGTTGQGYAGGSGGGGKGGGGAAGTTTTGAAGAGRASSITGTSVTRATGGVGYGSGGGGSAGGANTGNGGNGNDPNSWGGTGGSGIVILRYPDSQEDLTTVGAGLTYTKTTSGGYKIYSFTAGTGSITV